VLQIPVESGRQLGDQLHHTSPCILLLLVQPNYGATLLVLLSHTPTLAGIT
jgi:hypothetical protein